MTTTRLIINYPWKEASDENSNAKEKVDQGDEKLTDEVLKVALCELREDKNTREQCLLQLRQWIQQNKDIENCITDDSFLLRFLRVKKFSLHLAQQVLLKYLNLRRCFKYIFYNMDYLDPQVYELITKGYIFASPFKDRHGRRVVITTPKKFDTSKFNSTDMSRAHLITYETLIDDEETQIRGVTHIGDVADASPSLVTMWSINEFATLVKWGEQSFPMRHKEMHVLHMPIVYQYVYDFAASRVSQKLRDRAKLYNTEEELHKSIDPCVLPAEYGGVMPMSEMVELWKKELADKRDRLLSFDKMTLLSDKGIICRRSKVNENGEIENMSGSFRKLEVD